MAPGVWGAPDGHGGGFGGGGGFHDGGFSGGGNGGGAPHGGRGGGAGRGGINFGGGGPNWTFKSRPFVRSSFLPGLRTPALNESNRITTSTSRTRNSSASAQGGAVRQRPVTTVNHAPAVPAARAPGNVAQRGLNGRTDHISERHTAANWHSDWDRHHAHFFHHRFFVFDDGFWFGLDDGFFPWDYYPYYAFDYYPYDYYPGYYSDVEPYYNDEGVAYSNVPSPDPTVTTVQTRLTQLGYYNGPTDGVYGPLTRDAVARYQTDRNLPVTGNLSGGTLQSLGIPGMASNS
jgi:Putative peptidoglycan binding domain